MLSGKVRTNTDWLAGSELAIITLTGASIPAVFPEGGMCSTAEVVHYVPKLLCPY